MKRFLTSLKRHDGFTLVELMVVVAIIGLLSAVAIPNFKKYQAKAKVTEAKLQLSAAWTAEQAFFVDYNMYAHCLSYMGYNPSSEISSRYYTIGFSGTTAINSTAHANAVNSGLQAASCLQAGTAAANISWFVAGKGVGSVVSDQTHLVAATNLIGTQADTTNMTFVIGAGGVIDGGFVTSANSSHLSINESKVFTSTANRLGY